MNEIGWERDAKELGYESRWILWGMQRGGVNEYARGGDVCWEEDKRFVCL